MLLVNAQKLDISAAKDSNHPQHEQAKEYVNGLATLKRNYPDGKITIVRVGYPKYTDGIDHQGRDVKDLVEPTPPAKFPLSTYHETSKRGKELWECCIGAPKLLPGNMWGLGDKKSFTIEDRLQVDINNDADFAFYLCYISHAVKGGHLKIDDPKMDAKMKGDLRREKLQRETALWSTLADEVQLRKIAQAYNVADVDKKEPDDIRLELEQILTRNDEGKRKDPSLKGTKEFLEELKITDFVRLSAFIRYWMDEGMITYKPDGRYRVGDKIIAQVPTEHILKKFDWLCGYFASPNNEDKLKELLKDLVNKDYLDRISDPKDFRWLAKSMSIEGYFNQKEDKVKEMVYTEFVL